MLETQAIHKTPYRMPLQNGSIGEGTIKFVLSNVVVLSWGTLMLFVRNKERHLRIYIDYKELNKIIAKNKSYEEQKYM